METTETAITLPDVKEIEKQTGGLLGQAEQLTISDDESFMQAGELLLKIKTAQKRIEPVLDEPVSIQRLALERIRAWRDRYLTPIEQARQMVAGKIGRWEMRMREKRRIEGEKAVAEARIKAEKERESQIKEAKKMGDTETVSALKNAPIIPKVASPKNGEMPRIAGVTTTFKWDFEVIDPAKLAPEYLMPNLKAIKGVVDGLGGKAQNVLGPGVRVFEKPVTSGRA